MRCSRKAYLFVLLSVGIFLTILFLAEPSDLATVNWEADHRHHHDESSVSFEDTATITSVAQPLRVWFLNETWLELLPITTKTETSSTVEYRLPIAPEQQHDCKTHRWKERNATIREPKVFLFNTFLDEVDFLLMKLDEVFPVIDWFVIVQGTHTFQGDPNPVFHSSRKAVEENKEFDRYRSKIIFHVHTCIPSRMDNGKVNRSSVWGCEFAARIAPYDAVKHLLQPQDVIVQTDADEIPRREALQLLKRCYIPPVRFPIVFVTTLYFYRFGTEVPWHYHWEAISATLFDPEDIATSFQRTRSGSVFLHHAGWHCSWCMTPTEMQRKLSSFSHSEYNTPAINNVTFIQQAVCNDREMFGEQRAFHRQPLMDYATELPSVLVREQERFRRFLPMRREEDEDCRAHLLQR